MVKYLWGDQRIMVKKKKNFPLNHTRDRFKYYRVIFHPFSPLLSPLPRSFCLFCITFVFFLFFFYFLSLFFSFITLSIVLWYYIIQNLIRTKNCLFFFNPKRIERAATRRIYINLIFFWFLNFGNVFPPFVLFFFHRHLKNKKSPGCRMVVAVVVFVFVVCLIIFTRKQILKIKHEQFVFVYLKLSIFPFFFLSRLFVIKKKNFLPPLSFFC